METTKMESHFHSDAQKSLLFATIVILAALAMIPAAQLKAPETFQAPLAPVAQTGAIATEPELKVAFIGDSGYGTGLTSVLNLVAAEDADILIHLGDFDYVYDAD